VRGNLLAQRLGMATILARFGRSSTAITMAVALGSSSVAAFQLLSVQDEIQIGRDAQAELLRELPQVRDPAVRNYVSSLGRELASHASGAEYPYTFSTADYKELNAFALPGGPIWINRGVLDAADSEAQVAGVLAHEIAHVAGRHSARQITKSLWTTGILYVVGMMANDSDDWRAQAVNVAAMVTAGTVTMKFSRNDEKAADRDGVRLLEQAGYDPRGLLEFMEMLDAQQARSPNAVARFFATHPAPHDRVRSLTALVASSGGRRDSPEFADAKRRLAQLPPATAMP
jgi:predicted Zn-dependent protease